MVAAFVESFPEGTIVVSGGAQGVDTTAANTASACGFDVIEFLPDWDLYGKAAGFIRNSKIVKASDEIYAFWDGKSRGTAHTIKLAIRQNVRHHIVLPNTMAPEEKFRCLMRIQTEVQQENKNEIDSDKWESKNRPPSDESPPEA